MLKNIFFGSVGILLLSIPLVSFAQVVTCPTLTHNLRVGSRDASTNGEVSQLQKFLIQEYPSGVAGGHGTETLSVTGYFGRITQAYVIQFQKDHNLIPASGFVGPLTRAAIIAACGTSGGGTGGSVSFTATPTSGSAPLTVSLFATAGSADPSTFFIDFGDGTSGAAGTLAALHTYNPAGTYTAALKRTAATGGATVFTQTITVTGTTGGGGGTTSAVTCSNDISGLSPSLPTVFSPSSGDVPLTVNFKWGAFPTYFAPWDAIDFGDGSPQLSANDIVQYVCKTSPWSRAWTYTYASPGTYTVHYAYKGQLTSQIGNPVTVANGNPPVCEHAAPPQGCYWQKGATCADDQLMCSTGGGLTANPSSGPAPLSVIFNSNSAGNISFGDGTTGTMVFNDAVYVASHTYSTSGTYNAIETALCTGTACTSAVVGSATITVGSQSPNFTASPNTGVAPLAVQFTSTGAPGTLIGNTVIFGDGTTGTLNPAPVCATCNQQGSVGHTYAAAGTYTATLEQAGQQGQGIADIILGTLTVVVSSQDQASIVIANPIGQSYSSGSTLPISWTSFNAPNGAGVALWVEAQNQQGGYQDFALLNPGPPVSPFSTTGTFSWSIPPGWTPGTCKIHAYLLAAGAAPTCNTGNCVLASAESGAISVNQNPSGQDAATLSITPGSGPAPLAVGVTAEVTQTKTGTETFTLNYGDGQTTPIPGCSTPGPCNSTSNLTHTYTTAGSYTATITDSLGSQLASAPISVTSVGPNLPNFSANPTSGTVPLAVQFTSTGPVGTTIGSTVNFGDGSTGNLIPAPICATCNPLATVGHTYTAAGTYTATLLSSSNTRLGTATVTSGTVASAPTISSFTASPSTITAGQSSVLSWSTSNATSLSISGVGAATGNSIQVSPSQTTTYTLTATNAQGSVTAQAMVTVDSQSCTPGKVGGPQVRSGFAPLTDVFTLLVNPTSAFDGINFGDGTTYIADTTGAVCRVHTYLIPGTYTAYLIASGFPKAQGTKWTITVTAPTASTVDVNAQLANAYTALVSVLQQLIAIWPR